MKLLHGIAALGALAVLAGGVLAGFSQLTENAVQRNRQAAEARVVRELAGSDVQAADVAGEDDVLFCEQGLVVLRGGGRGYGGDFRVAVAVRGDGAVAGVRVIEHRETPGFGDILESGLESGAAWLESFRAGKAHAVTGATVTSTAVIAAVERLAVRGREEGVRRNCQWRRNSNGAR